MMSTGYKKASLIPHRENKASNKVAKRHRLKPTKPHRPSIERFINHVDRDLLEFLMDNEDKYKLFVRALHDPEQQHLSFTAIMKRYGITLHEIQALYIDGKRHMGLIKMANNLPQVLVDISEDSLSHYESCSRCDSTGRIPKPNDPDDYRVCPQCKGRKEIKVAGDKDARQQMLEAMKILGKTAPNVTLNQQFGSGGLEDDLQVTQKIVMGDR